VATTTLVLPAIASWMSDVWSEKAVERWTVERDGRRVVELNKERVPFL
jgi:hypothetical protein